MKDVRIMSHYGRVIWYNDGAFMVAKGDGTDKYFGSLEAAMKWIEDQRSERSDNHG